jgi:hypothetical protein
MKPYFCVPAVALAKAGLPAEASAKVGVSFEASAKVGVSVVALTKTDLLHENEIGKFTPVDLKSGNEQIFFN